MAVGYCEVNLHINTVDSLKGKRRVIKSIVERLRGKFNLSVAEVDDHDLWQVSTLGFAVVANERGYILKVLDAALRQVEDSGEVEVTGIFKEVY